MKCIKKIREREIQKIKNKKKKGKGETNLPNANFKLDLLVKQTKLAGITKLNGEKIIGKRSPQGLWCVN